MMLIDDRTPLARALANSTGRQRHLVTMKTGLTIPRLLHTGNGGMHLAGWVKCEIASVLNIPVADLFPGHHAGITDTTVELVAYPHATPKSLDRIYATPWSQISPPEAKSRQVDGDVRVCGASR